MIENILKSLHFDVDEIKTYILLLETGPVTAGRLAKKIGVPRSSLYGFLKRLEIRGLISESQKHGIKTFVAEAPEKINLLFAQQIENLQKQQDSFADILPLLHKKESDKFLTPKFQFFEGPDELKHALKDMLLYYDIETQAFWPQKKMVEILTPEFFRYHNKQRIKNNLSVRAIWPENKKVEVKDHPYFGVGDKFKREIRIAPPQIDFTMGYWIYGNKTVFISSKRESFGFIIESLEFAETLKTQFNVIWNISSPLIVNPKDTKIFTDELEKYG